MNRNSLCAALLGLTLSVSVLLSACASSPKKEEGSADGTESEAAAELEVHFFDAGKADAILLTTENSAVLIDAGEKGFGKTILSYLEEKGITRLDYLMITHFDQDHVGGAAKVLNNLPVGTVLQSNYPKDSEEYEKYVKALSNAGIEPQTVQESLSFVLDGVSYSVDPPHQEKYSEDASNNSSLIVSVTNGADSFLFTGDAETERLSEFLDSNRTTYDVLKVPHHGKDEELLPALIQSVSPAWAVITSSEEEPESAAVTEALEQAGVTVLLTRNGAVTFRSDGMQLSLQE